MGEGTLTCMITFSSTADDASGPSIVWVESMGGPLIVVPLSALASWGGCTESGLMAGDATAPDDYDRACAVDDLAGVTPIDENGAQALVLADEPATSCYLPQHRAFLRWLAADSEAVLRAAADTALADPGTVWEECGTWTSDGPAVLMDSAEAGSDLGVEYPGGGMPAEASVSLPAGRWRVRATQTKVDEENWVGLVQLLPAASCTDSPSGRMQSAAAPDAVQMGDAEHRMVHAIALETAVAQNLPGLHPGEGILDSSADRAVRSVVLFLPGRKFALPRGAAVRDDEPGTSMASVGDHCGVPDGGLRPGQLPCLAVVAVARQRPANHDHQLGVSVDDNLVIRRVPVVLGPLRHRVVAGENQSAVHDEHGALVKPLPGTEREKRPDVPDDAASRGLRDTEERGELPQRQGGAPVGSH